MNIVAFALIISLAIWVFYATKKKNELAIAHKDLKIETSHKREEENKNLKLLSEKFRHEWVCYRLTSYLFAKSIAVDKIKNIYPEFIEIKGSPFIDWHENRNLLSKNIEEVLQKILDSAKYKEHKDWILYDRYQSFLEKECEEKTEELISKL